MKTFIMKKIEVRKETIKLIDESIGDYKYWKLEKKYGTKFNLFGFIGIFFSIVLYSIWVSIYLWFENWNFGSAILLTFSIIIFVISLIPIIMSTSWSKKTANELDKIWDKKER